VKASSAEASSGDVVVGAPPSVAGGGAVVASRPASFFVAPRGCDLPHAAAKAESARQKINARLIG
jgi:hypothetical protein